MEQIITRFPPSPTGYLHLGGARTALFNWFYARHTQGRFVLRIEDTDRVRSTQESVDAIFEAMEWLGLDWDDGPYFQSQRFDLYETYIQKLLESGKAYYCTCSSEELDAMRKHAMATGGKPKYDGTCRRKKLESTPGAVVRFKAPITGTTVVRDVIKGNIVFQNNETDDFIIRRGDGTSTYNFVVVVDDITMGINTIIRGDDHVNNTPRQIQLYRALEADLPTFGHVPMVLGADRGRLSKRHGAMSVLEYRDMGYLPEALFNFLSLLGWNPGDDRERMSRDELVQAFGFGGIGKAAAAFDLQKLEWLNGQYLAEAPLESLVEPLRAGLEEKGLWNERYAGEKREWLDRVLELLRPRCRTLLELAEVGEPFFYTSDDFEYDPKTAKKRLKGENLSAWITALRDRLAALDDWNHEAMEACLRSVAGELEIGAGKLIHPTRLAVSGRGAGPGLFEILELIGRERTLARLDRLIAFVESRPVS